MIDRLKCSLGLHDYTDGVIVPLGNGDYKEEKICRRCGKYYSEIFEIKGWW